MDRSDTQRTPASPVERLAMGAVALFGIAYGTAAIGDNSMFVHIRTGVEMVRSGSIPRHDPYSFTAPKAAWVVQSWLAEWFYGIAYKLGGQGQGGLRLIVLQQAVLCGLVAWIGVRLARAGSLARTAAGGLLAVGAGFSFWSPRPLLFGLVCLGLLILVVHERRHPALLIPIMWVWVQTHGSFPLGGMWIVATLVGLWFDRKAFPRDELRYLGAYVAGLAVACLNPLGPKLLVFAATVGDKQEAFKHVVEWRSPNFQNLGGLVTLVALMLMVLVFTRRRIPWALMLPFVGQLALGLLAVRNLGPAALVATPALGFALSKAPAPEEEAGPSTEPAERSAMPARTVRLFRMVIAVAAALFVVATFMRSPTSFKGYPVDAVRFLDDEGLLASAHHLAHQDFVGCYLIFEYGTSSSGITKGRVFVDDRVDMYPLSLERDQIRLLDGTADPEGVLATYGVDVVLWQKGKPLSVSLAKDPAWSQAYQDKDWVVFRKK